MGNFKSYFNEQLELSEQLDMIYEKLIVYGGGAKYGQIVFMSGGAGSGKGFASSAFMESDKFKIRDVDEWKKSLLKIANLKNKYPEIQGLDLKNSDDVFDLHMFVKKMKIKDNTLDKLLSDLRADRLPNIMFDITGKEIKDFDEVIPILQNAGYAAKNMHLAWVLTDYKVSYVANVTRSRVVPAPTFLETHQGAGETMSRMLKSKKMPNGMDGRFVVVMNNRDNTILFKAGETYKGRTVPETAKGVKGFYYISVKEAGKPFNPEEKWMDELDTQIKSNIPGGEATIQKLRDHAIETLSKPTGDEKKDKENMSAVDLIKNDIIKDNLRKKTKKSK